MALGEGRAGEYHRPAKYVETEWSIYCNSNTICQCSFQDEHNHTTDELTGMIDTFYYKGPCLRSGKVTREEKVAIKQIKYTGFTPGSHVQATLPFPIHPTVSLER